MVRLAILLGALTLARTAAAARNADAAAAALASAGRYAEAADRMGREAAALCAASGDAAPRCPHALERWAYYLHLDSRTADVAKVLLRLEKIRPQTAASAYGRGAILWRDGRAAESLAALDESLTLDPRSEAALLMKGRVLASLGRADESIAALQSAVALSSASAGALTALADAYRMAGRYDESRALFARAVAASTVGAQAYMDEGYARLRAGDSDGAQSVFADLIKKSPDNAFGYHHMASLAWEQGHLASARRLLAEAEKRHEAAGRHAGVDYARTQLWLGRVCLYDEKPAEALAHFDLSSGALTPAEPTWAKAAVDRAKALLALGRGEEAAARLEKEYAACARVPVCAKRDLPGVLALRARVELALKRPKSAAALAREGAGDISGAPPHYFTALNWMLTTPDLSAALEASGDDDGARRALERGLELRKIARWHPEAARVLAAYGAFELRHGAAAKSLGLYEEAEEVLVRFPETPTLRASVLRGKAATLDALGRKDEAAAARARADALERDRPEGG